MTTGMWEFLSAQSKDGRVCMQSSTFVLGQGGFRIRITTSVTGQACVHKQGIQFKHGSHQCTCWWKKGHTAQRGENRRLKNKLDRLMKDLLLGTMHYSDQHWCLGNMLCFCFSILATELYSLVRFDVCALCHFWCATMTSCSAYRKAWQREIA